MIRPREIAEQMMDIRIEELSPVEKKLAVEIPWQAVSERLERAYRDYGRGVSVRGYRKGKVPRAVVERMFGKQIRDEITQTLVQESMVEAATRHDLHVVAEPVVEDARLQVGETFRYHARLEVRSEVVLASIDGIEATRQRVLVPDSEVDVALEQLRQQHASYDPITDRTVTTPSDVVVIALRGDVGSFPINRPELVIDLSRTAQEPLPGLCAALTGIPIDATDYALAFAIPEDCAQREIAGQQATFSVTVREARCKVVPALDDDLAKDTGESDTLLELRAAVRARLEERARDGFARQAREQVLRGLVERHPVPLAPALIERGVDSQLERAQHSLSMQGMNLERAGIDPRDLRERLRDAAIAELRGQLVLEAIAERESLVVSEPELDSEIARLAHHAREPTPPGRLKAEMARDGRLESVRWRLRQDKALDLVVSRATITEVDAPVAVPVGVAEAEPAPR